MNDRRSALRLRRFGFWLRLWTRAKILPWQLHQRSFEAVLELAQPPNQHSFAGLSADYIAAAVVRVTRRPWLMRENRCLRQGVLGFRFLSAAGFAPKLLFGIDASSMQSDRLAAHCWVSLNGQSLVSEQLPGLSVLYVHR